MAVINKTLVVSNKPKADLIKELVKENFTPFPKKKKEKKEKEGKSKTKAPVQEQTSLESDYDYLLGMKIWSLTKERVKQLQVRPS